MPERTTITRFRRILLFVVLLIAGCAAETPLETALRALVERAELAAEAGEAGPLRKLISDRYIDHQGNDKRYADSLIRLYLLQHKSIHLLTRIEEIDLSGPGVAEMVVTVAMAGRGAGSAGLDINADVYRFELELVEYEEGEWQIIGARWRRVAEGFD